MTLAPRIARAIFWGQAARVFEAVVFFVFYLWLARVLGPSDYGVFALGMSMAGVCVFLALAGLGPETLGRFVPEIAAGGDRARVRRLFGTLLGIRAVAILVVSGSLYAFRHSLAYVFHSYFLSVSFCLLLFLFTARSVFDLLAYFSSGLLDLKRVAIAKLTAAVVAPCLFLSIPLFSARSVNSAWLVIAAGWVAGILVLALPWFCAGVDSASREQADFSIRRILTFGLFGWITNFFLYILGDNTDVLLLGWLLPDRVAVGHYAAGAKIVFSLTGLLLGWVTLSSVSSLAEARQRGGTGRLASVLEAQWKLVVLCLVAPLFFLVCYAREIVTLFYSPAYAASGSVVRILGGLMACAAICGFSIQGGALYVLDRERTACAVVGFAALFNLTTEIVLVRRMGIDGAAWATGLSFVLLATSCTVASAFYVRQHFPGPFVARVVFAAVVGVASTLWTHPDSVARLAFAGALFAAVFFGVLAALKPLTGADSARLYRVNRRLGVWAERWFMDVRGGVKEA